MKMLMIFPFICLTLASQNKAPAKPFKTITISPFYNKKDSYIMVDTESSYLKFSVYLENDKYSSICIAEDTITKAGLYKYKYDNSYTRPNNRVYVRYTTNTTYYESGKIARNITKSTYRYVVNDEPYDSNESIVLLNSTLNWTSRKATYWFSGFQGIYVPQYYHKIDLYDFNVEVEGIYAEFLDFTGTLVMNNYDNAFKDIAGADDIVTFNLKRINEAPDYSLEIADDLYVHPETLSMSSTKKEGYVKTKYIYLPRNQMNNQDKFSCYIMLNDFGIDKDTLIHQLEFKATKNLFGNCLNSQYCVVRERV